MGISHHFEIPVMCLVITENATILNLGLISKDSQNLFPLRLPDQTKQNVLDFLKKSSTKQSLQEIMIIQTVFGLRNFENGEVTAQVHTSQMWARPIITLSWFDPFFTIKSFVTLAQCTLISHHWHLDKTGLVQSWQVSRNFRGSRGNEFHVPETRKQLALPQKQGLSLKKQPKNMRWPWVEERWTVGE